MSSDGNTPTPGLLHPKMHIRVTRRFSEMPQMEHKSTNFRMDDSNLRVLSKSKLGRSAPALLVS